MRNSLSSQAIDHPARPAASTVPHSLRQPGGPPVHARPTEHPSGQARRMRPGATVTIMIVSALVQGQTARAATLTRRSIGGPGSLKREIIGLESDMSDKTLDAEALRACPHDYQSDNGVGLTKPDGSRWRRFTFFCLDPSAEASLGAARTRSLR